MLSMLLQKVQQISLKVLTGNRAYGARNTTAESCKNTTDENGNALYSGLKNTIDENRKKKKALYSRISVSGDPKLKMGDEIEYHIATGGKVRFPELRQITFDLRKRRRFRHALEVSEWTTNNGIGAFNSIDHAIRLDLIGKVRGFIQAEKYFMTLSDEHKVDKTYGALLHCYIRQNQTEKALALFQTMREKGLASSPVTSNDLMGLLLRTSQFEKVPEVLNDMKKNGVSPNNFSYRMCISSYGYQSNIEGMDSILAEMEEHPDIKMDWNTYTVLADYYIRGNLKEKAKNALKEAEKLLTKEDGVGYNHVISSHARLGNKNCVLRLWGLQQTVCRCINRDYITVLKSLVILGALEEAEKILAQWPSSGNFYDSAVPCILVDGYLKIGSCEKAMKILEGLFIEGKSTPRDIWRNLAVAFLEKNDRGSAKVCMAVSFHLEKGGD